MHVVVVGWDGVNPSISGMPHPKEDRNPLGFGVKMKVSLLYTPSTVGHSMARSDSFFIRATVPTDTTNYNQVSIDLGSFVDALGKTVLRIHNISTEYGAPGEGVANLSANVITDVNYQLTTQSQTALVDLSNRSVIASGQLSLAADTLSNLTIMNQSQNAAPQMWNGGYLVAVESIFLGTDQGIDALSQVSIVLECTVETMTQAASMALALSQQ